MHMPHYKLMLHRFGILYLSVYVPESVGILLSHGLRYDNADAACT